MKKLFLLLPVAVLALAGCQGKGEKVSLKQAMTMMESQKVEEYPNDISANFKISTLEFRSSSSDGTNTMESLFALRDLKLGASFSGLTATDANLLKASVDFSLGSIQMKSAGADSTIKDIAASAYLQEQNVYVDVSNKTVHDYLVAQGMLPAEAPGKIAMPVDLSTMPLPLLSEENIQGILEGIQGGSDGSGSDMGNTGSDISGSIDVTQITTMISAIDESSLDSLFDIYVADDNKDYDINFSVNKKDVLRICESMFTIPADMPTSEIPADVLAEMETQKEAMLAVVDNTLTDESHVKIHASIDDLILRKLTIDIGAGIKMVEEGMTSEFNLKFKSEFNLNLSSKVKDVTNADEYKALA